MFDDEGQRLLTMVQSEAERMGRMIDSLLNLSHVGQQSLSVRRVDIGELARAVFEDLKAMEPNRKIQCNIHPLAPAHVAPLLFRQALSNLLSNAIKFTRPRETAVIEVGWQPEENRKVYYVKDNGVGFDMDYRDKLFEVFERLHPSEGFEGSGVGLAIVQRIISRHGGKVWAESRVNEGATFYFSLPLGDRR